MTDRPVVILSNRGPLSFGLGPDGELVGRRGAGGLVSGLASVVEGTDSIWVAAAMTDGDRGAAESGIVDLAGMRTRLLRIDPATYAAAYDVVCNTTLWYLHHGLYDLARRPRFDRHWHAAWDAYRAVNEAFADAAAEVAPPGAVVLVQDYHLALVGPRLAATRPDVTAVHFSHTPFCGPDPLRILPDEAARELLEGLAGHHACGFHTARWASRFTSCCEEVLGRSPHTYVSPLAADPDDLSVAVESDACRQAAADMDREFGAVHLIVRVDRLELTKNVLRGFYAFDDLLDRYPEWRGRVTFAAFVYPSREGLADYLAYRQEVEALAHRVNERWGDEGWTPVVLDLSDDFPRSLAGLQRADVVLVNPVRDGMNLVAKEGMLVNTRGAVLALSAEAGAWDELGDAGALRVHPFDVSGTADVLHAALSMPPDERMARAATLRAAAGARTPADWFADQLAAATGQ